MSPKLLFLFLSLLVISIDGQDEKEWWRTATFYQVYPRSFMDSNGDGIGDLKGIISKLEHLKEMGFDTYWLSPVFKSPQKDTGYDVSDYYTIEPDYGTMDDFEELVAKSKSLGLRLLLDFIPNHSSDQHDWFVRSMNNESDYRDYYVWHEGQPNPSGGQPLLPNNWISVFGGPAWTWVESRKAYYLHQFLPAQPDLNYRNEKLRNEMSAMLKYYIDKGVSGFRLDAINHMYEDDQFRNEPKSSWLGEDDEPKNYDDLQHIHTKDLNATFDFIYYWRNMIDEYRVEKNIATDILIMTEAYASIEDTMRYYRDPVNENRRGAHMPFNFQLIWAFQKNGKAADVKGSIDWFRSHMPSGESTNWVAGSHDHSRVASRVAPEFVDIANTVVTTLPGSSITYYGEEIGMRNNDDAPEWDGRNKNRTPMQWNSQYGAGFTTFATSNETWLPIHPNYVDKNVEAQKNMERSTYKYLQSLTALRKKRAFREGKYDDKVISEHVFAYAREYTEGKEGYIIVVNLFGTQQPVDLSAFATFERDEIRVATAAPNSRFSEGQIVSKTNVTLGPYDSVVFDYSSASGVIASFLLIAAALFASYFVY